MAWVLIGSFKPTDGTPEQVQQLICSTPEPESASSHERLLSLCRSQPTRLQCSVLSGAWCGSLPCVCQPVLWLTPAVLQVSTLLATLEALGVCSVLAMREPPQHLLPLPTLAELEGAFCAATSVPAQLRKAAMDVLWHEVDQAAIHYSSTFSRLNVQVSCPAPG